ncbi:MAG: IS5/IS1182 family transposase [Ignavibacteriae bacterium]|nr:MAG: IS5/IS1182 family transposase [Ignavibacteriota bacterium]
MRDKNQRGLFDEELRLEKLTKSGDPLVEMNKLIDWEMFRPLLTKVLKKEPKRPGGRPPYDYVMMFKILILQRLYNLSDEQMEYQINDRLSFLRFLGLNLSTDVPDRNTIWLFREKLINAKAVEKLFAKFDNFLEKQGVIAHEGSIVDATFLEVPRQRNNREDNATIKSGSIPEGWEENPNKLSQKDTDARWTKKNEEKHYGYKNHIKVDKKSKIIISYKTTNASVHDSQALFDLLDEKDSNNELFADSAYSGKSIEELLSTRNIKNQINEKGYRGHPLTEEQKKENREKSKVRARVEHIFGFIKNSMKGSESRLIGFKRNEAIIGLINFTYNICRSIQLARV